MHSRAQTATEYLILLAVAIIIALVAISVLGGIPGIGGSSGSNAQDAYWQTSEISVSAYAFSEVGSDSVTLKNNMPVSIVITDVRMHPTLATIGTVASSTLFINAGNVSLANQTIAAGGTFKYNNGTTVATNVYLGNWSQLDCTAGETYTYYIEIDYEDVPTGATYTFDGSDTPLRGTCAN